MKYTKKFCKIVEDYESKGSLSTTQLRDLVELVRIHEPNSISLWKKTSKKAGKKIESHCEDLGEMLSQEPRSLLSMMDNYIEQNWKLPAYYLLVGAHEKLQQEYRDQGFSKLATYPIIDIEHMAQERRFNHIASSYVAFLQKHLENKNKKDFHAHPGLWLDQILGMYDYSPNERSVVYEAVADICMNKFEETGVIQFGDKAVSYIAQAKNQSKLITFIEKTGLIESGFKNAKRYGTQETVAAIRLIPGCPKENAGSSNQKGDSDLYQILDESTNKQQTLTQSPNTTHKTVATYLQERKSWNITCFDVGMILRYCKQVSEYNKKK